MNPILPLYGWAVAVLLVFWFAGTSAGAFAAVIAWLLSWSHRQDAFGFAPFMVDITFTRAFLEETGIANETQRALLASGGLRPSTGTYWPLGDGVRFSVLRWGLFSHEQNLIYWKHTAHFSTRLDAWLFFEELKQELPPDHVQRRLGLRESSTPSLEFDQSRNGIQVWLTLGGDDRKLLLLIPHCMFNSPRLKAVPPKRRQALLQAAGWSQEEEQDFGEHGRIAGDFRHKYMTAAIRYI